MLRVLFFQDRPHHGPPVWVAQALERDIAAFGPDLEAAKLAFERTLSGYLEIAADQHTIPLASLAEAPDIFWEIWNRVVPSHVQAERMPSIPAFMVPAVTYDQVSA